MIRSVNNSLFPYTTAFALATLHNILDWYT